MKFERLMFFGDSFAREISDKQYCWKTLLSIKLGDLKIGHWGEGGSSKEITYNYFKEYLESGENKITDLCIFCWTNDDRRSINWQGQMKTFFPLNTNLGYDPKQEEWNTLMARIMIEDKNNKQTREISKMSYYAANYLMKKYNVKNVQYFCFEDSATEFGEDFDINSLVKNAKDYSDETYYAENSDHFSPIAAHEFVNKIYKDLTVKYAKRI